MSMVVVVNDTRDWPLEVPGVSVVQARAYLTDPHFGTMRAARVVNLCKSSRYQSLGYYVSLLAEARGHKPMPRAGMLEDIQSRHLLRYLLEGLDEAVQKSLAAIASDTFELAVYFGRSEGGAHDALGRQIFGLLQIPLLRANFEKCAGHWRICSVRPLATADIPAGARAFVTNAASAYLEGRGARVRRRALPHYELAILHDPDNPEPASNAGALKKFEKAALSLGMGVEFITRADYGRLPGFDALFIRDTTFMHHYTYRFSRRAAAEGQVVIDDPDSILKCNNKVYLAEILERHRIAAPRTLLVERHNTGQIVHALSLPCVLKQPDSSFSLGVVKVASEQELHDRVSSLLEKSELIIAQEYLPTEFDWRIGIIDRKLLFAARYYMAPGHWQIIKHGEDKRNFVEGPVQAVDMADVPDKVLRLALRAANLIGDGFYGVDIKQTGRRCVVIEINDNPNVDAGNEDGVIRNALYREVMGVFLQRLDRRRAGAAR